MMRGQKDEPAMYPDIGAILAKEARADSACPIISLLADGGDPFKADTQFLGARYAPWIECVHDAAT